MGEGSQAKTRDSPPSWKPSMQGNPLGAQLTFPQGGDRPHPPPTWVTWPVAAGLVASSLALSFCQPIVHTAARTNYSKRGLFTSPGFIPFIQRCPPWRINTFCSGKLYFCTSQCASQCLLVVCRLHASPITWKASILMPSYPLEFSYRTSSTQLT